MRKLSLIAVLAGSLFGASAGHDASAAASFHCTAANIGATMTTSRVWYNGDGSYAYTDYTTYVCTSDGWVWADVTRCFPIGRCVPL